MAITIHATEGQKEQLRQISLNIDQIIERYYIPSGLLERFFGKKRLAQKKAYVKSANMVAISNGLKQFAAGELGEKMYDQWMLMVTISLHVLRKADHPQDFEVDNKFSFLLIDALMVFKDIFAHTARKYEEEVLTLANHK